MSAELTPEAKQAKAKEFLGLLPLTQVIAGLPIGNGEKLQSPDIMELRANNLKAAYKYAKQLIREVSEMQS